MFVSSLTHRPLFVSFFANNVILLSLNTLIIISSILFIYSMIFNFLFLIFDYGEKSQTLNIGKNPNGSARCFYKNQISNNFYENFQKQDITFSVNFQLLKESFTRIKAKEISFETQSKFLLTNGFVEMLEAHRPPDLLELQNIKKLVSPSSMGEAFKVMLLAR